MGIEIAVIKKAKRLMEEFPDQLLIENALQIASQIQIAEVLYKGLHTGVRDYPPFLEAIAMSLGYQTNGLGSTLPEAISGINSNELLDEIAVSLGTGGKNKIADALYEVAEVLKRHLK